MKLRNILSLVLICSASSAFASNIVWVSDQVLDTSSPPKLSDQGYIDLLTAAGHTVSRSLAVTPNVAALNAADLIILGRSAGSGNFDSLAENSVWNTQITKPILATNAYLTRGPRLGWFNAASPALPDLVSNPMTFLNIADAVTAYLIGGTSMTGATTTNSMTEAITFPNATVDARGTSLIADTPVLGATIISTTLAGAATANNIVMWPAGTALSANTTSAGQILSGFRMQFLTGNRESGTAPVNTVAHAGYENLTPEGEAMFLRAVTVAINNGAVPEPGSTVLAFTAGALALGSRRRRCA